MHLLSCASRILLTIWFTAVSICDYISRDLFCFVNLTGSCALSPCILPVNTVPYYGGLIETCQNVNVGDGGLELSSEPFLVTRMILQPFTSWINRSPFLWPPFWCKGRIDGDMTSKGRWNPLPSAGTWLRSDVFWGPPSPTPPVHSVHLRQREDGSRGTLCRHIISVIYKKKTTIFFFSFFQYW